MQLFKLYAPDFSHSQQPLSCPSQFFLWQQRAVKNNFQEKELSHKYSTLVLARLFVATVYQEPHFWRTEGQKLLHLYETKRFSHLNPYFFIYIHCQIKIQFRFVSQLWEGKILWWQSWSYQSGWSGYGLTTFWANYQNYSWSYCFTAALYINSAYCSQSLSLYRLSSKDLKSFMHMRKFTAVLSTWLLLSSRFTKLYHIYQLLVNNLIIQEKTLISCRENMERLIL